MSYVPHSSRSVLLSPLDEEEDKATMLLGMSSGNTPTSDDPPRACSVRAGIRSEPGGND